MVWESACTVWAGADKDHGYDTSLYTSHRRWDAHVCCSKAAMMGEDNDDAIAVVLCLLVIVVFLVVVISAAIPAVTPVPG